jgi:hypothetical protein
LAIAHLPLPPVAAISGVPGVDFGSITSVGSKRRRFEPIVAGRDVELIVWDGTGQMATSLGDTLSPKSLFERQESIGFALTHQHLAMLSASQAVAVSSEGVSISNEYLQSSPPSDEKLSLSRSSLPDFVHRHSFVTEADNSSAVAKCVGALLRVSVEAARWPAVYRIVQSPGLPSVV